LGYTYDAGWNLTQRTSGGAPVNYGVNDRNQVITGPVGSNGYDANGNRTWQTYDANGPKTYNYTYDDENQLTSVATDTYYTPPSSRWRTDFLYDGRGRLRRRTEYNWNPYYSQWQWSSERRYLHDGTLVIQERDQNNTPTVTYTRGLDLSGSLPDGPRSAGGIGGSLARSHGYVSGTGAWSNHNFYQADAGGNITAMADNGSPANLVASYRYDPYGRIFSQSGSLATANVYRFSSKEYLATSGLYYYGFRFYDPLTQRWLNRDPMADAGSRPFRAAAVGPGATPHCPTTFGPAEGWIGPNLYRFVDGAPVDGFDPIGLKREPGQSFKKCYHACRTAAPLVDLADDLGYWGLGSAAVGFGMDFLVGRIDQAAANAAKDALQAGANHPGPMGYGRLAVAKAGAATAARIGAIRLTLRVVGKISGPVGIVATVYSGGVSAYCAATCL
jgi:RHS repeat-associated protein